MTKNFHERFKIPIDFNEARQRFVNRAHNLIFDDLLDQCGSEREWICREIVTMLGLRYVEACDLELFIRGNFTPTLLAIKAFYRAAPDLNRETDAHVKILLEESEVNLSILWHEGHVFLERAPLLDEKLVNDVLGWLEDPKFHTVIEPFQKGVRHLLDSAQRPDLRADAITDMYKALEALAKIVTGRTEKDLSTNRELFVKRVEVSEPYRELLKQCIDYANDFRHTATAAKPRQTISDKEAESFVYLTGVFLRLAMPTANT